MKSPPRKAAQPSPPKADISSPARPLASRWSQNPLLTAADISPSQPNLEVVSVFNAAAVKIGKEFILLLRVAEQPRAVTPATPDVRLLDLSGAGAKLVPMPEGTARENLVGTAWLDLSLTPPEIVVGYLPRDTPGLDLNDPRCLRYHTTQGSTRDLLTQISHLRVARSQDGIHFTVEALPALSPASILDEYGCEDPHITLIDDTWHITYVSVSRLGVTTSLATTKDFVTFERQGVIFPPDNKDVALFPARIQGRYFALHRPMPPSFSRIHGIWLATSPDLVHWGGHLLLALPREGYWDSLRTGAGCVPFLTAQGWLAIYHGADAQNRYSLGALLLDAQDPSRVIARSRTPILDATQPYEISGLMHNVVFTCGHVPLDDRNEHIRVYYGGADSVVCAADFKVAEILASLDFSSTDHRAQLMATA